MDLGKRIAILMFLQACTAEGTQALDAAADGPPPDTFARSPACDPGALATCPPKTYATWPMPNPASLPLPNAAAMQVNGETAIDQVYRPYLAARVHTQINMG